ncbi:MAG: hypothetical protein FD147_1038 [Chloroflexi bacterium]|nr:MAG: hypothetical protein FD147_1038 [Chloroflexota bacterium]
MFDRPVQTHMPSVAQLVISIIGLFSSILTMFALGLLIVVNGSMLEVSMPETQQMLFLIWISGAISLLTLPSLVLSIRRLARKSLPQTNSRKLYVIANLLAPAIVFLIYFGNKAIVSQSLPAVKAILTVILVTVPLWWFVELGRHHLNSGSPQRQWGLVNFGVYITLPIVIFVELVLIAIGIGIGIAWLMQQPEFTPLWMQMQTELRINPQEFPNILAHLEPLLQKPGVIAAGFFGVAILIPLVEELFKPLALWFFMKRNWSPAEGFTAGLLSGAAFAMVESLTSLSAVPNEAWLVTIIGRVGTGLLHILTTGLIGWALTASWRDGRYLRVGMVYLASVTIHGVWNFFALLFGLGPNLNIPTIPSFATLSIASPWILVVIALWMITILFAMNRKLRIESIPPVFHALPFETIE